jgi:hypothetical protein
VVAEVMEIMSVSKLAVEKFDMDRFNLKRLSGVEFDSIRF